MARQKDDRRVGRLSTDVGALIREWRVATEGQPADVRRVADEAMAMVEYAVKEARRLMAIKYRGQS